MESGVQAMLALIDLSNRPSAVLCSNDTTAIGVLRAAFDKGLRIPQDLSVVGFDDIRLSRFMSPPLTTVEISQTQIAHAAFQELLDSVEAPGGPSSRVAPSIRTNLILRSSTGLAPDRVKGNESTGYAQGNAAVRHRSLLTFCF